MKRIKLICLLVMAVCLSLVFVACSNKDNSKIPKGAFAIVVENGRVSVGDRANAKWAKPGDLVMLYKDEPLGMVMHSWSAEDLDIQYDEDEDLYSFTMPSREVHIIAVFDGEYIINVIGGNAVKEAKHRELVKLVVDLSAIPDGQEFERWIPDDSSIVIDGHYFRMPAKEVTFTAQYRNIRPKYGAYKILYETNVEKNHWMVSDFVEANALPIRPLDVEKERHSIIAWFRDDKFTKPFDFDNPLTQDIKLFAKWSIIVYTDPTDTFHYGLTDDNEIVITALTENGKNQETITLPESISGYPVTTIGSYAFVNNNVLKTINMPDSITAIRDKSFSRCSVLETVSFSNNLKIIGISAFEFCSELKSVAFPDSLEIFRLKAFSNTGLTSVSIPQGVKVVSESLFEFCFDLESATIGAGVEFIDYQAFYNSGLKSINLPANVKTVGIAAFMHCDSLETFTALGVVKIAKNAFTRCAALMTVNFPDTLEILEEYTFVNCASLERLDIGANIKFIGERAFKVNAKLKNITIRAVVPPEIGFDAFMNGSEIFVPESSIAAYKAAPNLAKYENYIKAIS